MVGIWGAAESSLGMSVFPKARVGEGKLFKKDGGSIRVQNGEFVRQEVSREGSLNQAANPPITEKKTLLSLMRKEDPLVMCPLCGPVFHKNALESHRRGKKHKRVLERCTEAEGNGESRVVCYVCMKPFGTPNALRQHQLESVKHKELYYELGVANLGVPPGVKRKRDEGTTSPGVSRDGAPNGRGWQGEGTPQEEAPSPASPEAPPGKRRRQQGGREDWEEEQEAAEFERKRQKRAERFGGDALGGSREAPALDRGITFNPPAERPATRIEWERLVAGDGESGTSAKASARWRKAGSDQKGSLNLSAEMPPTVYPDTDLQGRPSARDAEAQGLRGQSSPEDVMSVRLPRGFEGEDSFRRRSESVRRRNPSAETLPPAGFGTAQQGLSFAGHARLAASESAPAGDGGVKRFQLNLEGAPRGIPGLKAARGGMNLVGKLQVGEGGLADHARAPAEFQDVGQTRKAETPKKWLWEGGEEQEADGEKGRWKRGLKADSSGEEALFGGRGEGVADGTPSHSAERGIPQEGEWRPGRVGDTMAGAAKRGKPGLVGAANDGWGKEKAGIEPGRNEELSLNPWLRAKCRAFFAFSGGFKTEAPEENPPAVEAATRDLWAPSGPTSGAAASRGLGPATGGVDHLTSLGLGPPFSKTGRNGTPADEAPLFSSLDRHNSKAGHASSDASRSLTPSDSTPQLVLFPLESQHSAEPPKSPVRGFDLNQPPPETDLEPLPKTQLEGKEMVPGVGKATPADVSGGLAER
ncbi:hypothetical protein KFL_000770045 [Klebsormidium nitens]|uniref:Uncharacterized protein n=1 Tax=Klebsormidium nitens TaxID=105231 RepID=A0A1Y1HWF9_KLENI|nr:hypothetical protein KFL_000770045 [Klebsormidium nitens]|eukprot:GAQ81311.1 hypothetical protein KFL_000770045 [Klebsormidium nitens]